MSSNSENQLSILSLCLFLYIYIYIYLFNSTIAFNCTQASADTVSPEGLAFRHMKGHILCWEWLYISLIP